MDERIEQAEQAIRGGDTRSGFDILRKVLAENPNSEKAWWIMSGLVPREQRAHCLNEVLRINPDNQLARETLQELGPQPPGDSADGQLGGNQFWFYTRGSRLHLTLLAKEGVIAGISHPELLPSLQRAMQEGKLPEHLLTQKQAIPYRVIQRVRQIISSLRVFYLVRGKEESLLLQLEDESQADQVLDVLAQRLGPDFLSSSAPMRRASRLLMSAVMTLGAGGVTAFFLWGAFEVSSGRAAATGSIRTQAIINILELLGPIGVGVLGGLLTLLALILSIRLLIKPPSVTELIRS